MSLVYLLMLMVVTLCQLGTPAQAEANVDANGMVRQPVDRNLLQSNAIVTDIMPADTAYVGVHYERGTYYDHVLLTALRTMMKTVEASGTTRDRVVLVLPHTKQSTRDILINDGLKLIDAPNALYNQGENKCWHEFRVIDVFALTQYKRVLYLDSDHLVENNMDHLFLCGEFCMEYNSLIHFTDTVFVIKPSIDKYSMLMEKFQSQNYNHVKPKFCVDEAAAFWINAFGDIEAAPLFPVDPERQYNDQSMRLSASVSLNAMLWYEKFSWSLMKHGKYMNITDPSTPPGLSIGFHSLKPYFWPAGIFFNLNWYWTRRRTDLLHESYITYIITTTMVLTIFYLSATKLLRAAFYIYYTKWRRSTLNHILNTAIHHAIHPVVFYRSRSNSTLNSKEREKLNPAVEHGNGVMHMDKLEQNYLTRLGAAMYKVISMIGLWCPLLLSAYLCSQGMRDRNHLTVLASTITATVIGMISIEGNWLYVLGSDICGWVFGLPMDVCLGFIVYEFIPSLTPPHYAWPTFILAQIFAKYTCQHIIVLSYSYQNAPSSSVVAPYSYSPVARKRTSDANNNGHSTATDDHTSNTVDVSSPHTMLTLPFSTLYWHTLWSFVAWGLCRLTFFPEFAVKMAVLFPVLVIAFWTSINSYRNAFRLIENDFKARKQLPH